MKPITQGLGPLFADLERRARETQDLTTKVRQALTGPEKDHVISASYREDTLVVVIDSAAWGSRLRFLQDDLLKRLQDSKATQVTKLHVRVGAKSD
ncbi:MAG TPA: DciA family protein [Povalibacter sp.]